MCKCKCRLDAGACNNKQRWSKLKCRCECKESIDKGVRDEGFIWNPSNRECDCNNSCDLGEYLDYENCKRRKRLVNKLVQECTKNSEEVKLAKITLSEDENKHKCSSCTICNVLFSIIFTISIGIGTYFVYCQYINRNKETASKYDYVHQQQVININGKYQANKHQKSNLIFFNDLIKIEVFDSNLLKIDKSSYTNKGI